MRELRGKSLLFASSLVGTAIVVNSLIFGLII